MVSSSSSRSLRTMLLVSALVWVLELAGNRVAIVHATAPPSVGGFGSCSPPATTTSASSLGPEAATDDPNPTAAVVAPPPDGDDESSSGCSSSSSAAATTTFRAMHDKILQAGKQRDDDHLSGAFLAALDQSGGSTPNALAAYGLTPEVGNYEIGTESMFDAVHQMRTRIVTSPSLHGDKILGAILFEDTMDRTIEGQPTCSYLWERKGIVPFLKIDKGLEPEDGGVQMLQPIPDLEALLERARSLGVYGTKARSLIRNVVDPERIDALVRQQFEVARRVLDAGLVPIIEPEVDIHQDSADKQACEEILCRALLRELDQLLLESDGAEHESSSSPRAVVLIKITLPETANQYAECVDHPCCLRVVALSGGYDQRAANAKLAHNRGVIASFSRALSEGLSHGMAEDEFDACLSRSIDSIYAASAAATAAE